MKTIQTLLLFAAAALLPLTAQESTPATQQPADLAAAPSPEAVQVTQDAIDFLHTLAAIVSSDKQDAEKCADIRALKSRAADIGRRVSLMGKGELRAALMARMTEEEIGGLIAAIEAAEKNPALSTAFKEIENTMEGRLSPDTTPEDIAQRYLDTLRRGAEVMEDAAMPATQKRKILRRLTRQFRHIVKWLRQGGDSAAVAAQLHANAEFRPILNRIEPHVTTAPENEDSALTRALADYANTMLELTYELYGKHRG